jgi:outer membrane PBP1 activator LpoA protein
MQKLAPLIVGVMAVWLCVAQAQEPDYIIQSNAAPLNPIKGLLLSPSAARAAIPPVAPSVAPVVSVPAVPAVAPVAAVAAVVTPQAETAPVAVPLQSKNHAKVRIGLLLPTESKTLGDAAQVVRAGFEAAATLDGQAEVVYVDEQQSDVVARYRATVASGVKVMVGPLTRQGIAAIAPYVTVPTLTLNALDANLAPNAKLLSLSLTVEGEARQMARLMRDDGRNNPLVVRASDVLSRRLTQAFVEEWQKETGAAPQVLDWPMSAPLTDTLAQSDAVFIAMMPPDAAALKAALPASMTVYATSQLNLGKTDASLAGIRFIDMPWFLMTEQAEVKRYPRPSASLTVQTERLYALGIDAYRLAVQMATTKWSPGSLRLHGVTGDLKLGRDRQFDRILPLAVMMPDVKP